jgi:diguanylate cyclase (GGDEF)-like protein
MVLDVDRLRTINEALGHHVGDRALRTVADLLRSSFRVADLVARTEADEFAVLALEAPDASGQALAARIRAGVEELNRGGGIPFHLAVSVGAVKIGPESSSLEAGMDSARQEMRVEKFEKRLTTATEDR